MILIGVLVGVLIGLWLGSIKNDRERDRAWWAARPHLPNIECPIETRCDRCFKVLRFGWLEIFWPKHLTRDSC